VYEKSSGNTSRKSSQMTGWHSVVDVTKYQ